LLLNFRTSLLTGTHVVVRRSNACEWCISRKKYCTGTEDREVNIRRKRFLVLVAKELEREDEGDGKHVSGNGLASLSTEAMVKMIAKGAEEIGKNMANWAEALKQVTQVIVSPDNDTTG
jgi:hypothetical protein